MQNARSCYCGTGLLPGPGVRWVCGRCHRVPENCRCRRLDGEPVSEEAMEAFEGLCARGRAEELVEFASAHDVPVWLVRLTMRDHDWSDEAIEEVAEDLGFSDRWDRQERPEDPAVRPSPSQTAGQPATRSTVVECEKERVMANVPNSSESNGNGQRVPSSRQRQRPELGGITTWNPRAQTIADMVNGWIVDGALDFSGAPIGDEEKFRGKVVELLSLQVFVTAQTGALALDDLGPMGFATRAGSARRRSRRDEDEEEYEERAPRRRRSA